MKNSSPPSTLSEQSSGSGLLGEGRQLISSVSLHLLTLLKLAQLEAGEAYGRIIRKVILLVIASIFFLGTYFTLNAAGACYLKTLLDDWTLALLALSGANVVLGLIFILIGSLISTTPLFKDTLTELENDLLWITEKYRAKQNSSRN